MPGHAAGKGVSEQRRRGIIHEQRHAAQRRTYGAPIRAHEPPRQDGYQIAIQLRILGRRLAQLAVGEYQHIQRRGGAH